MIKIEATNLQEAYKKAASELNCSVVDLGDVKILQKPRNGFLGLFKKNIIIEVGRVSEKSNIKKVKNNIEVEKNNTDKLLFDIKDGVLKLVKSLNLDLDKVDVSRIKDNLIFIELDGKDANLLIGKDGSRYRSFSHLMYNWLNSKYKLSCRLEIGNFLKIHEENLEKYLSGIIEKIRLNGKVQTKTFDSLTIKIILKRLREEFPKKYVGIKTNQDGRYIIVNDFKNE